MPEKEIGQYVGFNKPFVRLSKEFEAIRAEYGVLVWKSLKGQLEWKSWQTGQGLRWYF
jgi:hypothetical protein